jgi:hypothetical protein
MQQLTEEQKLNRNRRATITTRFGVIERAIVKTIEVWPEDGELTLTYMAPPSIRTTGMALYNVISITFHDKED